MNRKSFNIIFFFGEREKMERFIHNFQFRCVSRATTNPADMLSYVNF